MEKPANLHPWAEEILQSLSAYGEAAEITMYIDHSLYPDLPEPPETLDTPEAKADYLHRVATAWDFQIHPEPETFELLSQWKDVFDRFPVLTSPSYHAFRAWFGWEPMPMPADLPAPDPAYVALDAQEGRGEDPCRDMI